MLKDSYATAVKGAQEYNSKVMEFAKANTEAAFAFAQSLSGIKSPSDFITLSTEHSRKQLETLAEQSKELAALVQKISLASTEPLKAGVTQGIQPGRISRLTRRNFQLSRSSGDNPGFVLPVLL